MHVWGPLRPNSTLWPPRTRAGPSLCAHAMYTCSFTINGSKALFRVMKRSECGLRRPSVGHARAEIAPWTRGKERGHRLVRYLEQCDASRARSSRQHQHLFWLPPRASFEACGKMLVSGDSRVPHARLRQSADWYWLWCVAEAYWRRARCLNGSVR